MAKRLFRTPEARFNLKKEGKGKRDLIAIRLIYHYDRPNGKGITVTYYTGDKIAPVYWDFARLRAKVHGGELSKTLNEKLDRLSILAREIYSEYSGNLSADEFKQELDRRFYANPSNGSSVRGLPDFMGKYIERYELDPNKSEGTVKSLKRARALIDRYREDTGETLDFTLTVDQITAFKAWLFQERPGKRALEISYVSRMLGIIRQFFRAAYNEEKHSNRIFENTKVWEVKEVRKPKVALTESELRALYEMEPLADEKLERVRVMFLVECFSGLRFSDVRSIRPEHVRIIDGECLIELTTVKTKTKVAIPCPDELLNILKRYDYHLPKLEQSEVNLFNRRLKQIARSAGLFRPVRIMSTAGNIVKDEFPKLHEVISSHTGRRTWATLRYLEDFSISKIQKVLDHASEEQTKEYIDMDHLDAAADMAREMKRINRERERRESGNHLRKIN